MKILSKKILENSTDKVFNDILLEIEEKNYN